MSGETRRAYRQRLRVRLRETGEFKHGTDMGYAFVGCRCIECCQYGARARRRGLPDGSPLHGTPNGYNNYGCRCPECTAANTAVCAEHRAGTR